jgi:hypothetical protein
MGHEKLLGVTVLINTRGVQQHTMSILEKTREQMDCRLLLIAWLFIERCSIIAEVIFAKRNNYVQ